MNSPLITVIVPVYNKDEYVAKLIECVQKQEFRDFECILVDDGSTDKSGKICDEMAADDDTISVIHIQNGGVSHARNVALEMAKGEYITFLDSDDEIPIDYLKRIAEDIRLYNPDMVIGGIKKVYESGSETIIYPFDERVYTMQELLPQFAEAQRDCGVFGWCVNKTFKRELAESCRFDEALVLCEDFDFFIEIYKRIYTIYFDLQNYYLYFSDRGEYSASTLSQIDYLSGVKIQIRLKLFLCECGFWKGNNQIIVSQRIMDFLFFSVFHCPKKYFRECFERAHMFCLKSDITITEKTAIKKIVLQCISKNRYNVTKLIVLSYRRITTLLRR